MVFALVEQFIEETGTLPIQAKLVEMGAERTAIARVLASGKASKIKIDNKTLIYITDNSNHLELIDKLQDEANLPTPGELVNEQNDLKRNTIIEILQTTGPLRFFELEEAMVARGFGEARKVINSLADEGIILLRRYTQRATLCYLSGQEQQVAQILERFFKNRRRTPNKEAYDAALTAKREGVISIIRDLGYEEGEYIERKRLIDELKSRGVGGQNVVDKMVERNELICVFVSKPGQAKKIGFICSPYEESLIKLKNFLAANGYTVIEG
jgi:hypothetical protein